MEMGRNSATLTLRCEGAAGASKDGVAGLGQNPLRMLRGIALRPKRLSMREEGVASLTIESTLCPTGQFPTGGEIGKRARSLIHL